MEDPDLPSLVHLNTQVLDNLTGKVKELDTHFAKLQQDVDELQSESTTQFRQTQTSMDLLLDAYKDISPQCRALNDRMSHLESAGADMYTMSIATSEQLEVTTENMNGAFESLANRVETHNNFIETLRQRIARIEEALPISSTGEEPKEFTNWGFEIPELPEHDKRPVFHPGATV